MTVKRDEKAYKAVIRARTVLLVTQPFFGCLALHLNLVEDAELKLLPCPTMGVDGFNLYYYPKFVLKLSEQELIGVVAHEVMHCAYRHITRRGHRHPVVYNWAGDFSINSDLKKAGFVLPGQPITMLSPPGGHLYDPQYDGMSTEEIYEKIYKQVPKTYMQMDGAGDGKGDKKGNMDRGGCGVAMDAAPQHDKAGADEVEREWEQTVRMAVNVARAANAGNIPGHLERLVKELKKPKVNWRDLTRQFIDQSMSKDYSWSRPNRRHLAYDLVLPGFVPDALHHLVFISDISGSIGDEMTKGYLGEMQGALDTGVADKLTVIYADTHVRNVDEWFPGDIVTMSTVDGGGTNYNDAFDWVAKNAPDAQCIIYLTDMMPDSWNIPTPDVPVLWAAYASEQFLAAVSPRVPFGQIVHVSTET